MTTHRPLAVVTGASRGIGLQLARRCALNGYDLVIAADDPAIEDAATNLRVMGSEVRALEADLGSIDAVDRFYRLIGGTPDLLLANAGRGLGKQFLDQDFESVLHVVDTNITGTIYLVQKIGRDMRRRQSGHILITAAIAGFAPGGYNAVLQATSAFLTSFVSSLRDEMKETGVTITCLLPGSAETGFTRRPGSVERNIAAIEKADPAEVARLGFDAMMRGDAEVAITPSHSPAVEPTPKSLEPER